VAIILGGGAPIEPRRKRKKGSKRRSQPSGGRQVIEGQRVEPPRRDDEQEARASAKRPPRQGRVVHTDGPGRPRPRSQRDLLRDVEERGRRRPVVDDGVDVRLPALHGDRPALARAARRLPFLLGELDQQRRRQAVLRREFGVFEHPLPEDPTLRRAAEELGRQYRLRTGRNLLQQANMREALKDAGLSDFGTFDPSAYEKERTAAGAGVEGLTRRESRESRIRRNVGNVPALERMTNPEPGLVANYLQQLGAKGVQGLLPVPGADGTIRGTGKADVDGPWFDPLNTDAGLAGGLKDAFGRGADRLGEVGIFSPAGGGRMGLRAKNITPTPERAGQAAAEVGAMIQRAGGLTPRVTVPRQFWDSFGVSEAYAAGQKPDAEALRQLEELHGRNGLLKPDQRVKYVEAAKGNGWEDADLEGLSDTELIEKAFSREVGYGRRVLVNLAKNVAQFPAAAVAPVAIGEAVVDSIEQRSPDPLLTMAQEDFIDPTLEQIQHPVRSFGNDPLFTATTLTAFGKGAGAAAGRAVRHGTRGRVLAPGRRRVELPHETDPVTGAPKVIDLGRRSTNAIGRPLQRLEESLIQRSDRLTGALLTSRAIRGKARTDHLADQAATKIERDLVAAAKKAGAKKPAARMALYYYAIQRRSPAEHRRVMEERLEENQVRANREPIGLRGKAQANDRAIRAQIALANVAERAQAQLKPDEVEEVRRLAMELEERNQGILADLGVPREFLEDRVWDVWIREHPELAPLANAIRHESLRDAEVAREPLTMRADRLEQKADELEARSRGQRQQDLGDDALQAEDVRRPPEPGPAPVPRDPNRLDEVAPPAPRAADASEPPASAATPPAALRALTVDPPPAIRGPKHLKDPKRQAQRDRFLKGLGGYVVDDDGQVGRVVGIVELPRKRQGAGGSARKGQYQRAKDASVGSVWVAFDRGEGRIDRVQVDGTTLAAWQKRWDVAQGDRPAGPVPKGAKRSKLPAPDGAGEITAYQLAPNLHAAKVRVGEADNDPTTGWRIVVGDQENGTLAVPVPFRDAHEANAFVAEHIAPRLSPDADVNEVWTTTQQVLDDLERRALEEPDPFTDEWFAWKEQQHTAEANGEPAEPPVPAPVAAAARERARPIEEDAELAAFAGRVRDRAAEVRAERDAIRGLSFGEARALAGQRLRADASPDEAPASYWPHTPGEVGFRGRYRQARTMTTDAGDALPESRTRKRDMRVYESGRLLPDPDVFQRSMAAPTRALELARGGQRTLDDVGHRVTSQQDGEVIVPPGHVAIQTGGKKGPERLHPTVTDSRPEELAQLMEKVDAGDEKAATDLFRRVFRVVGQAHDELPAGDFYIVRQEVMEALERRAVDTVVQRGVMHGLARGWRTLALNTLPRTVVNNVLGSIPMALFGGAGPLSYLRAARMLKQGGDALPGEIRGVGVAGGTTRAIRLGEGRLAKPIERWMNTMRRGNVFGEDAARAAVFLKGAWPEAQRQARELGTTADEVLKTWAKDPDSRPEVYDEFVDKSFDFLGNFASGKRLGQTAELLTRGRAHSVRDEKLAAAVPFHRWYRHIVRLTLVTMPAKYPGRAVFLQRLAEVGDEYRREHGVWPSWARDVIPFAQETVAVGPSGQAQELVTGLRTQSLDPFATPAGLLPHIEQSGDFDLAGVFGGPLGAVNPVFRTPIEAATTMHFGGPRSFQRFEDTFGDEIQLGSRDQLRAALGKAIGAVPLAGAAAGFVETDNRASDESLPWDPRPRAYGPAPGMDGRLPDWAAPTPTSAQGALFGLARILGAPIGRFDARGPRARISLLKQIEAGERSAAARKLAEAKRKKREEANRGG
jgi:hypothetical protein